MFVTTTKDEAKANLIEYLKINAPNLKEIMLNFEDNKMLQILDSDVDGRNQMLNEVRALVAEVISDLES